MRRLTQVFSVFICLLFVLLSFTAAVSYFDGDYVSTGVNVPVNLKIYAEYDDFSLLVAGSSLIKISSDENTAPELINLGVDILYAETIADKLYVFTKSKSFLECRIYSFADEFELLESIQINELYLDIDAVSVTSNGNIVYMLGESSKRIKIYHPSTKLTESLSFTDKVESFTVYADKLYVKTSFENTVSVYSLVGSTAKKTGEFNCEFALASVLTDNLFVDVKGNVRALVGEILYSSGVLQNISSVPGIKNRSININTQGELIVQKSSDTIWVLDSENETQKYYYIPEKIIFTGKNSALAVKNKELYIVNYDSLSPINRDDEDEESSGVSIPSEWNITEYNGNEYLIFDEGTYITDLKEESSALFSDNKNREITSGTVKTGDRVIFPDKEFVVVVPGDTNGNGKINSSDFEIMQKILLNENNFSDEVILAADLDFSMTVGNSDLIVFRDNYL